jgi:hypothetical protein
MSKSMILAVFWVVLIALFLIGLFCFVKGYKPFSGQKGNKEKAGAIKGVILSFV